MKYFVWLLVLVCFTAHGSSYFTTKISGIDLGTGNEPNLMFLSNGRVVKFLDRSLFQNKNANPNTVYEISVNEDRYIESIKIVDLEDSFEKSEPFVYQSYVPTTVKDLATLKKYFNEAPYNPKDSQCFNRAMVWSYGWWKQHSLRSMKLFIFFTRSYIRRYNFEWWFHVAPYAHVMTEGKVVERVLDVKYTRGPLSFKQWTDVFMKNDAACPVITKYSDYADYPYTGDCYIYRANMYFYQPADLQMNEAWGYDKTNFIMNEVRGAYKEAFDIDL